MASTNEKGESRGRGFAGMDPVRQRQISSQGGKAAHQKGTAHEFDSEEAREAGRKGGMVSGGRRRSRETRRTPRRSRGAAAQSVETPAEAGQPESRAQATIDAIARRRSADAERPARPAQGRRSCNRLRRVDSREERAGRARGHARSGHADRGLSRGRVPLVVGSGDLLVVARSARGLRPRRPGGRTAARRAASGARAGGSPSTATSRA